MTQPILLVEDNPATRKIVSYALERRGHTVLQAADGHSALELMTLHRPALVLLDLTLPDTSGFNLMPQLRERARSADTMFVAFSGFLSSIDEMRLAAVPFDDVIAKPIEPDRLVARIEAHLPRPLAEADRFGVGKTAVIADGDPLQLKLLRFRMKQLGFEVSAVNDGQQALALAIEIQPDVLIAGALMPKLDGFELAMALRRRPEFHDLPMLLVTSSYVETADRKLAKHAGATDLIVSSGELDELVAALSRAFARPTPSSHPPPPECVEEERGRRVVKQLERQVNLNSRLAQRCAALSGELAVLTRISEGVLKNGGLEDDALDEALAACFDAGGISVGALYHLNDGELKVRALGAPRSWAEGDLESFFGHAQVLYASIASQAPTHIPSAAVPRHISEALLQRSASDCMLVIPLKHRDTALGALVMFARQSELNQPDWLAFAQAITNQISQVLALAAALGARAKAEQLAQERSDFLDALLEQAPDAVLYIDAEGCVRYASQSVPGSDGRDVVGESLFALPSPSSAADRRSRLAGALRGDSLSWEETHPLPDGTDATYWCKMGPVRRQGRVAGAVMVARDISEKKRQDAQLMAADRMISVGTMAAGVAHEINNPLTSVIANLELAATDLRKLPTQSPALRDIAEAVQYAREAADQIRTIARDLRVYSRAEADTREPVDVERLLESTLRMAWNEVRHRAHVVRDFGHVPAVRANEARLGQVFLNLLVNAAHAIPEGDSATNRISLSTALDAQGRVTIRVTDSGAGIPEQLQGLIFTPFFTTKPAGVGTGLGLSICRRIVTSFDGQIWFKSEPGCGTEFCVALPQAQVSEPAPRPTATATSAGRRGRVLVVDDEARVRDVVKRLLGQEHDVVTTDSGVSALELLQQGEPFDVILCDLMMPQLTGMQLYAAVLAMDPATAARMVFLTGGAFSPASRDFLDAVANHRVEKPFDCRGLRSLINSLMG